MTDTFDHLYQPHWSVADRERAEVIFEFVRELIHNQDFDTVTRRFADSAYVQHNRLVGTGLTPLVDFTRRLVKMFPSFVTDLKHVYVDGEFVVARSHATTKVKHRGNDRKGLIIVDTWRIVDGNIVEHWDAIQPLSFGMRLGVLIGGGSVRNKNGVF